jgi:hypothetical protein
MDRDFMKRFDVTVSKEDRATQDMVLYCASCGKQLMNITRGSVIFANAHDWQGNEVCDCSWNCCSSAMPSGSRHPAHLAHKTV